MLYYLLQVMWKKKTFGIYKWRTWLTSKTNTNENRVTDEKCLFWKLYFQWQSDYSSIKKVNVDFRS